VYDSVDSIRWSRPEGQLYVLAKRGSHDLRKLLWMAQPPLPTVTIRRGGYIVMYTDT
jgi:hypothetical protein